MSTSNDPPAIAGRERINNMNASSIPASTETLPSNAPDIEPGASKHEDIATRDFYFLPIPKHLRHNPDAPPRWTLLLNIVFGVASTFIVANLYYCQPILIKLSTSFNVSYDEVSRIPTLVQAGYATGLLLISPLGDLVRRRPLILLLTFLSASFTIGLPLTSNIAVFEALSFLVGTFTVVPQVLMPLAADLAPPERRASALSIVLSGLLFGILMARVLSGIITEFTSWRVVYYMAIGLQWAVLGMLWITLPDYPRRNKGMTYWGILWSMAKFLVTEPLLVQAVLVNMASMATFTNFWVTLTFLLGGPPYFYSTLVIGLFGLVGMFGVAMAPLIGHTIDKLVPWFATTLASVFLLIFQAIQTGAGGVNIAAVIIVCFGIDVFRQMQQVSLTSSIFGLEVNARSRLNAILIISLFIGQVMGTSVGTSVFTRYGWRPAAALSVGWTGFCLIVMFLRGPNCKRYTWIGWEGGWEIRKSKREETDRLEEKEKEEKYEEGALGQTEQRARKSMEEMIDEKRTHEVGREERKELDVNEQARHISRTV